MFPLDELLGIEYFFLSFLAVNKMHLKESSVGRSLKSS